MRCRQAKSGSTSLALEPGRRRQALRAQEFGVEELRLVAVAVIGEHRHDGVAGAELLGEADGAGDIDAGRAAEAQPFLLEQVEDDGNGLLIGDLVGRVDRHAFEIVGDAALADAFGDRGAFGLELAVV